MQVLQSETHTNHRQPVIESGVREIVRLAGRGRDVVVDSDGVPVAQKTLLTTAIACVRHIGGRAQSLVVVPGSQDVQAIATAGIESRDTGESAGLNVVHLGPSDDARNEALSIASESDIVVTTPQRLIDHIRRGNVDLGRVSVCIVRPPDGPVKDQFGADLHYIYAKFNRQPSMVLFGSTAEEAERIEELIRRPTTVVLEPAAVTDEPSQSEPTQEQTDMAKPDLPFDPESTAKRLREIVKQIHEHEDAVEMNQYKRFIKKHVSVFSRAYFTAYLFKQLAGGATGGATVSSDRASVFVSAGRNRRVHARDLVTLFTSADGVSRDDIGQIKVLDNYSFVEVENSKAKQAIDSLNGTDFRGRKLTVNFARRK